MTNCIKLICRDYNTDKCFNCNNKITQVQNMLFKIDKKLERNDFDEGDIRVFNRKRKAKTNL